MNNKIGIHYMFWAKERNEDLVSYIYKVAKLGFEVLGISLTSPVNMTVEQRNAIKTAAADAGIELNTQIGLPQNSDISSLDVDERRRGIEFLKRNIQITHDMGGKVLSGVIYSVWGATAQEKERSYYLENSVKSMKEIVRFAEDTGIFLNVEVLNRFEQFLINTGEQALEYVRMVDSPNIKIELDTFHMNIEEDNIGQAILNVGNQLGMLHVCENNRKLPGKGHIPWMEVAKAIREINYTGHIVIESFARSNCKVAKSFNVWRNLEDNDLDIAAKESLEFLRSTFNG
jgi:D-psicose/D-tagatose/L-ribulose 3-epimerase